MGSSTSCPRKECEFGLNTETGECMPAPLSCEFGLNTKTGECMPAPLNCEFGLNTGTGECMPARKLNRCDSSGECTDDCKVGELCYMYSGTVKNNQDKILDTHTHPMRYDADTLIFGANDSNKWFKMIATDNNGVMKETRFISTDTVNSIQELTPDLWVNLDSKDVVSGKTECTQGEYCVYDVHKVTIS